MSKPTSPIDGYNQLIAEGIFEILPQKEGPSLFIVHRKATMRGDGGNSVLHEKILINPSDGVGRNTDNPLIAENPLLTWIRQQTGWTSDRHNLWMENKKTFSRGTA